MAGGVLSKVLDTKNPAGKRLFFLFSSSTAISFFIIAHFLIKRKSQLKKLARQKIIHKDNGTTTGEKKIDRKDFLSKLKFLLNILIKWKWNSKELLYMTTISSALVFRSVLDLWTIYLGTLLESSIIEGDSARFKKLLLKFAFTMPTMALTNSVLKYGTEKLKICFRQTLTSYVLTKHMKSNGFYKLSQFNILNNPDQLITNDIEKFCTSLSSLYGNLSKPILDIIIYVYGISSTIGWKVPFYMLAYLALAAGILVKIRKPMAKMTSFEQQMEGDFRYVNSRVLTNSEEIAFYNGADRELESLRGSFKNLIQHLSSFNEFKFVMNFFENIIAKYIATVVGYWTVSRPFFHKPNEGKNALGNPKSSRIESYYKSGRMLLNLSHALGSLVMNGKEISRLNGYTSRVYELVDTLTNLEKDQNTDINVNSYGRVEYTEENLIKFEQVPITTPNGDVLIKEFNLEVRKGCNVLVTGPNGCGKSSLFRILGELWPLRTVNGCSGGILTKPRKNLFYIPQRPYMTLGTLRDQIIYPDTLADMKRKKLNDQHLLEILKIVDMEWLILSNEYGLPDAKIVQANVNVIENKKISSQEILSEVIEDNENKVGQRFNLNAVENWMEVLSGGQKQRIAMARLIYHSPKFAILDECTSAVSVDVEGKIYSYCKLKGITLFTVTHRKSLFQFHDIILYMDGRGNYDVKSRSQVEIEEQ